MESVVQSVSSPSKAVVSMEYHYVPPAIQSSAFIHTYVNRLAKIKMSLQFKFNLNFSSHIIVIRYYHMRLDSLLVILVLKY